MPNYMTVKLETTDEDFDFRTSFKSFNDVKTMPKILGRTIAGSLSNFVEENYDKGLKWLLEHRPEWSKPLAIARSYHAKQATGYFEWYTWCNKHWGTKWDMQLSLLEKDYIIFEVPWSVPEAALQALSQKYPDINFEGEFVEEQVGYISGTISLSDGRCYLDNDEEYSNEAYERYFSLCGGEDEYKLTENGYVYIDDEEN